MTTTEHLNAIVAKCRANLALAEKRTPGSWFHNHLRASLGTQDPCAPPQIAAKHVCTATEAQPFFHDKVDENMAYIAACAGAAEAGWRATAEEIESLLPILKGGYDAMLNNYAISRSQALITAWPEELL